MAGPVEPISHREQRLVGDSDIDELGHVSNLNYIRWILDVALGHSKQVGYDYAKYLQLGLVFVVRRHEVEYLRPAFAGDRLELRTWIEKWSAATSVRHTRICRLADGQELVRGVTTWALVSLRDGRPSRIPAKMKAAFAQPPIAAAAAPKTKAKESSPKRRSPKKVAAKKVADKKVADKKLAAEKAAAEKAAAEKAAAEKAAAEKAAAEKAAAEKAAAKKAAAKKAAAKKAAKNAAAKKENVAVASDAPVRPFVKWAGGKRSLLGQLRAHMPAQFKRYHEPFVGSGALFFDLKPTRANLADNNERLIRSYRGLRDDVEGVIKRLRKCPHDKEFFLKLRRRDIDRESDAAVAAWFLYLNRVGFNGLYRVNSKNEFNVPFGRYKNPTICNEPRLRACSAALKDVRLEVEDFEKAARRARKGDMVYFDPPYVPLSQTSSFRAYTSGGFDMEDHVRLRDLALALRGKGVHVLLSNSAAPAVRELYGSDFELIEVRARRSINSKIDSRQEIAELLIR